MGSAPCPNRGDGREYDDVNRFVETCGAMTYETFDRHLLDRLTLFDIPKEDQFHLIEDQLDQIIQGLPTLRRIFAHPLIRLRDTHEIVPVEQAHIVDSQTLSHLSRHTELWDAVSAEGIRPRKLMAVGRVETYAIYENMVLVQVVDAILRFLERTRLLLRDVLYDFREMPFNFLDRTNHDFFFHAFEVKNVSDTVIKKVVEKFNRSGCLRIVKNLRMIKFFPLRRNKNV